MGGHRIEELVPGGNRIPRHRYDSRASGDSRFRDLRVDQLQLALILHIAFHGVDRLSHIGNLPCITDADTQLGLRLEEPDLVDHTLD